MRVFVSPKYPFADAGVSYPGTMVDELVSVWNCGICEIADCPHIAFLGTESHGLTSYAVVAERADINEATLAMILKADPNARNPQTGEFEEHVVEYLECVAKETIEFAGNYPVGQMVERCIGGVVGVTINKRAS